MSTFCKGEFLVFLHLFPLLNKNGKFNCFIQKRSGDSETHFFFISSFFESTFIFPLSLKKLKVSDTFPPTTIPRWWFQISFIFTPTWGDYPTWLIFFKWVETTNNNSFSKRVNKRFDTKIPPMPRDSWCLNFYLAPLLKWNSASILSLWGFPKMVGFPNNFWFSY